MNDFWPFAFFAMGFVVCVIAIPMGILPIYNVWRAHKEGQADLAKARNDETIYVPTEANLPILEATRRNEC